MLGLKDGLIFFESVFEAGFQDCRKTVFIVGGETDWRLLTWFAQTEKVKGL
jgi:hypothetical protein